MSGPNLTSFLIYNPTFGPREGQEHLKVLYYYPESENSDVKVNNVGLCEALVQFARTYSPHKPCESLHTQKHRQVFLEAEQDFWLVMTVSNPWKETLRESKPVREYMEEDIKDIVLLAVLKEAYSMFKLFMGTFKDIFTTENVEGLKKKLKDFYTKYIPDIDIQRRDILDVHNGIQFHPVGKTIYLRLQSFINLIKSTFPQIKYTLLFSGDKVLWSGVGREDSRIIYAYVVNKLLPTSSEFENSMISSYLTRDGSYGRFLAGVRYYEHSTDRHTTTMFVNTSTSNDRLLIITYQVLNMSMCLLIEGTSPPSVDTFRKLDVAMGRSLIGFSTDIENSPQKPSESLDASFKYIYFNAESLSWHSSCHSKDSNGFIRCSMPAEVMKVILNICKDFSKKDCDMEVITKVSTDFWVVGKKSEQHECYIVMNQKNANLIEVNEEVKKICANHISCISLTE